MAILATVSGTAIRPGVSRNNRRYTAEAIGRAVERAQQRIAKGDMPLTTLTHHEAGDDSTRIVGRISSITQEADGSASYTAEIADTAAGRDILALVSGPKPVLKGVSIRGAWLGKVRREQGPDGNAVETADDLELDGLDYTRKPGVLGAQIDSVELVGATPRESDGSQRVLIAESAPEATVTITEADTEPAPAYADPGYQGDKQKRYDVGTKAGAIAAWAQLRESDTARRYTSAQLKRINERVRKALRGHGVNVVAQEGWLVDAPQSVSEALSECWDMAGPGGSLYVSLTNGPTTVTVSSSLLDPHDLDAVGRAAMAGACQAILGIDPDLDADVDVPEARETILSDRELEERMLRLGMRSSQNYKPVELAVESATAETGSIPEEAPETATAGEPTPALETSTADPAADPATEEEPAMAESITPAADTAAAPATGGIHLTDDQFAQLLARMAPVAAPVEAAPAVAAPVAETAAPAPAEVPATAAAPVTESDEDRINRLVAEGIKAALPAAIQESVERGGGPARKGLVETTAPADAATAVSGLPEGWPQKPLHKYTDEEFRTHVSSSTANFVLGGRGSQD